jgi:hypothetical protein
MQGSPTEGVAQYGWPPCTNEFRLANFYIENFIYFFTKLATLMRRSSVLSFPLRLVFSDWFNYKYFFRIVTFLKCSKLHFFLLTKMFLFYIDFFGNINCNAFSLVTFLINDNLKTLLIHCKEEVLLACHVFAKIISLHHCFRKYFSLVMGGWIRTTELRKINPLLGQLQQYILASNIAYKYKLFSKLFSLMLQRRELS